MPESKLVESILFEAPPVVQYPPLLPEDGKPSKEERKLAIHAMQLRLRGKRPPSSPFHLLLLLRPSNLQLLRTTFSARR